MNDFIALIGEANSGKTTSINAFVDEVNGVRLAQTTRAICSVYDKTVFTINTSPQERAGSEFLGEIKKDIVFFEDFAKKHHIETYVILMAFTKPKTDRLIEQRIEGAKRYISQSYNFISIPQVMGQNLKLVLQPFLTRQTIIRG